jgi:CelD/BcsL family acetyltransferase involved in cellulose biosynthesis
LAEPDLNLACYRRFSDAEDAWRTVAAARGHYVFQSFDWLSLWHNTSAEAERVDPFIVCVIGSDRRPAAVFPLGIRHRYGCRALLFLGGDVTDYNAPLFTPAALSEFDAGRINGLWQRIVKLARPDLVRLLRMPETFADGAANPVVAERHARHSDNAYAATPLSSSFAAFAATRSRRYFADTRRKRRKLERLGRVAFEIAEESQVVDAVVSVMLRQKRRRIAESGANPMPPHREQFYRALGHARIADGRPHVTALRVDGEVVATHLGVVHQDRFYWLMPGYESGRWASYSVGRALLQSLVEWCIANSVSSFDLTVGDEDYKRFWANTRLRLYESHYARTLRGAGLLAASRLRRATSRRAAVDPG